MLSNQHVYNDLTKIVADRFLKRDAFTKIEYSPLEINDFSICIGIDVVNGQNQRGVYIKIPKCDLYKKKKTEILPITKDDKKLADEEYRSLCHLSESWDGSEVLVNFVEVIGFIERYNAIVTSKIYANYLLKVFRKSDLLEKFRICAYNDKMHSVMQRLGTALKRFHLKYMKNTKFCADNAINKTIHYCSKIKYFGVNKLYVDSIMNRILKFSGYSETTQTTKTLKGLDIRNLFIDQQEAIFILDPGKMKDDFKEADLARLIVTCKIVYWGSLYLFLRLVPDSSYEDNFFTGYYGSDVLKNNKILRILIVKELVKHWYLAHVALQLKTWPNPLKKMLRIWYIDSFYKRQLEIEIRKLEICHEL